MHARTLIDGAARSEHDSGDDGTPGLPSLFDAFPSLDWPVPILERRLPELLLQAESLSPADHNAWLVGLHQAWDRHGWALARDGKGTLLELALEKLGFEELGISWPGPGDSQLFYRWGEQRSTNIGANELHLLLARMGPDTRAAMPVFSSEGGLKHEY